MFTEPGAPHHQPHFHAYYQNDSAVFAIESLEIIGGGLSARERRLVEAWAELHRGELLENWERLQFGNLPLTIAPLR